MTGEPTATYTRLSGVSLADLVERITARVHAGEAVDEAAELNQYPEHADELRRLLPALAALAELSRSCEAGGEFPRVGGPCESGVLGDYRIVRELGHGGMGVVYEAEQISLPRRVALKVLPFAAVMDPRHLQRFKNEARAAASLDHPNVVKVYGVGCERGVHFIAMQFIDGRTLAELVRERRDGPSAPPAGGTDATRTYAADVTTDRPAATAPEGRATRTPVDAAYARRVTQWGIQAAEALEHAHALGIVHRDVKPGNLLVDGRSEVFVADFGLAKLAADPELTRAGDVLGTLRYMSPEQAGARHDLVDHRSDVYSLGVTLYELLTLTPAFSGTDRESILARIAATDPTAPRKLDPRIPRDLETVVLKAMEKDPSRRYQSAREFAEDLGRVLCNEPVKARRATLLDRAAKWSRRHRAVVWSGVALLAMTAAVSAVAAVVVWREKNAKELALKDKTDALAAESAALADRTAALGREADERARAQQATAREKESRLRAERNLSRAVSKAALLVEAADTLRGQGDIKGTRKLLESEPELIESLEVTTEVRPDELPELWRLLEKEGDWTSVLDVFRRIGAQELGVRLVRRNIMLLEWCRDADPPPAAASGKGRSRPREFALFALPSMWQNLSGLLRDSGRPREAEAASQSALRAWEAAVDTPELRGWHLFVQATIWREIAGLRSDAGGRADAEDAHARALGLIARGDPNYPFGDMVRQELAQNHAGLGDLYHAAGRVREATAAFHQATRAWEQNVAESPGVQSYKDELAWFLLTCPDAAFRNTERAADLARATERPPVQALVALRSGKHRTAIEILDRELGRDSPVDRAVGWYIRAAAHWQLGERTQARKLFDGADRLTRQDAREHRRIRQFRAEAAEVIGVVAPPPRARETP